MFDGFYIDGVRIKSPSAFDVEYYTLTKSNRVASGDMVMDFVANKRKYTFTWDAITSAELNPIIDLLWTNVARTKQCFHQFTYTDDTTTHKVTVYAGAIPHTLHRGEGRWVWKNVKISIIEQ